MSERERKKERIQVNLLNHHVHVHDNLYLETREKLTSGKRGRDKKEKFYSPFFFFFFSFFSSLLIFQIHLNTFIIIVMMIHDDDTHCYRLSDRLI